MSSRRLRLLFLLPFAPRAEGRHGGAAVTGQLVTGLARRHDVRVLHLSGRDDQPVDSALREACDRIEGVVRTGPPTTLRARIALRLAPLRGLPIWAAEVAEPAFAERAAAEAAEWRPDVIQVEYPVMGQYLGLMPSGAAARILVDHDAGSHGLRSWPGMLGGVTAALDKRAWRAFERRVSARVDSVVVFTQHDKRRLEGLGIATPIEAIPFGILVPEAPLDPGGTEPLGILFVGNFTHPPNVDAALWLARRLFPAVRAKQPGTRLTIVGPQPPAELRALAGEGVEVTGEVPDVTPYLDVAAVVAAPIRAGGGMRVKVLEAMAAGKAVVATDLAVEGLDVVAGEHLEVATDEAGIERALLGLLENESARRERGRRAREWAVRNLGWDRVVARYEALYERLRASRES